MFNFAELGTLRNLTRQQPYPSDYRFGLLPIPRGPQMETYAAGIFAAHMYHIFNDIYRPEQVAAVLVAMANRLTRLDIVQHELEHGLQDMPSGDVVAMLLDKVVVDHSRIHGGARGTILNANQSIETLAETPVQAMQRISDQVQTQFNELRFD